MKQKKKTIIHIIILVFIAALFSAINYLRINFSITNFSEILYSLKYGNEGADNSIFVSATLSCLPLIIIIFLFLYTLFYDITFNKKKLIIKGKQIYPIKLFNNHKIIFTLIILLLSLVMALCQIGFIDYFTNITKDSTFIKDHYVETKDAKVEFEEKRNLVFIMVESLETTMFTKEQTGSWSYELIPELYNLQNDKDAVVFYNKKKNEQINMLEGSSWTTASLVSNLSGTPLKVDLTHNIHNKKSFMNNLYTLGDLLEENGYHNEVISGARTSFGGLQEYFKIHGNYTIIDENTLKDYNLEMKKSDIGKWGFNDKYLFETAKKRIDILAKDNKPFNIELITIDTHFVDGFVGDYSTKKYKTQYENAYATESKLISDFISWLKEQDYYKNTTIVISGDHLTMQSSFFKGQDVKERYVYNCVINPRNKEAKTEERIITSLDNYPTMVYAIGGNIKGNRLGLGTNLFSNKKTLSEEYGFKEFSTQLKRNSKYYNNQILNSKER